MIILGGTRNIGEHQIVSEYQTTYIQMIYIGGRVARLAQPPPPLPHPIQHCYGTFYIVTFYAAICKHIRLSLTLICYNIGSDLLQSPCTKFRMCNRSSCFSNTGVLTKYSSINEG